jgi:hypothetical protein
MLNQLQMLQCVNGLNGAPGSSKRSGLLGGGGGLLGGQTFDGTNDYLTATKATAGFTNSTDLLIYGIVRTSMTGSGGIIQSRNGLIAMRHGAANGRFSWDIRNDGSTAWIWRGQTSALPYNDGTLYEFFLVLDNQAGTPDRECFVGPYEGTIVSDYTDIDTTDYGTGNNIAWDNDLNWGAGGLWNGGQKWNGDLFTIAAWDDQSPDVSSASVRSDIRDFASPYNTPAFLYRGDDWATTGNEGSGGDFTINGTLDAVYYP